MPPIRLNAGFKNEDDPSFDAPQFMRKATGARYKSDSERVEKNLGRIQYNIAIPSSGDASISTLDFNSATDQILYRQGTSLYIGNATLTHSTFAPLIDQKFDEDSDADEGLVFTSTSNKIVTAKIGDAHLEADGTNAPILIENNLRARVVGLSAPVAQIAFSDASAGGSVALIFAAKTNLQTQSSGGSLTDQWTEPDEAVVTPVNISNRTKITTSAAANIRDGSEATYATYAMKNVLSGKGTSKGDKAFLDFIFTTSSTNDWFANVDFDGQFTDAYFKIDMLVSTDSGATFTKVNDTGKTNVGTYYRGRLVGRKKWSSNIGSVNANTVVIRLKFKCLNDTTNTGTLNLFKISLDDGLGGGTVISTTETKLRYLITSVRTYERTLSDDSTYAIEVESEPGTIFPAATDDPLDIAGFEDVKLTLSGVDVDLNADYIRFYRSPNAVSNEASLAIDAYTQVGQIPADQTIFVDRFDSAPIDYQDPSLAPPFLLVNGIVTDSNTPPPSDADVIGSFAGSALYASSAEPGIFRWSHPLAPDYVPSLYSDTVPGRVTAFIDIGLLIVLTAQSVHAYSFLSLAADANFNPGRARRDLSTSRGCISPRGAASFQMPGREIMAAFVSGDGLYAANGGQVIPLSKMLDWPTTLNISQLSSSELVDDPADRKLVMSYLDNDGNRKALDFYYDRAQIVASGPRPWPSSSTAGLLSVDGTYKMFSEQGGIVYIEKSGLVDGAALENADKTMLYEVQTIQVYPFGPGSKGRMKRFFFHTPGDDASSLTVTVNTRIDGKDDVPTVAIFESGDLSKDGWKVVGVDKECESFVVNFTTSSPTFPGINGLFATTDQSDDIFSAQTAI